MSNEISISGTFVRTRTLKSGDKKAVVRTMLGVVTSGNSAEKCEAAEQIAARLWANNTIAPVIHEVARVFASKALTEGAEFLGLDFANPKYDVAVAWLAGVERSIAGKDLKGEKAVYGNIVRMCLFMANEKAEAKAAALANA